MKKMIFQTKYLIGLVVLLFLAITIPTAIFAAGQIFNHYTATTTLTTGGYVAASASVNGHDISGAPFNVYNLSSQTYLVPNNSAAEFTSFYTHAPNYVSVSICGDLVCENGENFSNCPVDCVNPSNYNYCGDGVCTTNFPTVTTTAGIVIPLGGGETTTNCPQDCGYSTTASCGPCGYNGAGQICLNECNSDTNNNLINCCHAYTGLASPWGCCGGVNNVASCPAGSYCPAGGYGGALAATTCQAGYYCPSGSVNEYICPAGTYSAAGASACTACPTNSNGAITSKPGSTSVANCVNYQKCGDGVCNGNETPVNCPKDCQIAGDGLCTGSETMANTPSDCHCGDGKCNYGESMASCPVDCACGDGACDYGESSSTCSTDCKPGDGTCDSGKVYNSLYPNDCLCGNGTCDGSYVYISGIKTYILETYANCPQDCHCGDGVCNYGETHATCPQDCHCGDGICEPQYSETTATCSADCYCGNQTCDSGETSATCPQDCPASYCGDGICNYKSGETATNCPYDCGYCGDGTCGYNVTGLPTTGIVNGVKEIPSNCSTDCGPVKPPVQ